MSKIIKLSKAKPIKCQCCGCVYEFESGDKVDVVFTEFSNAFCKKTVIGSRELECPCCHFANKIEFESSGENE